MTTRRRRLQQAVELARRAEILDERNEPEEQRTAVQAMAVRLFAEALECIEEGGEVHFCGPWRPGRWPWSARRREKERLVLRRNMLERHPTTDRPASRSDGYRPRPT